MASDNVVPFNGNGPPSPPDGDSSSEGKGDKPKKREKKIDWDIYHRLLDRFALIYGTDTVWDEGTGLIMKISAMAHAWGADYVRMWKSAPSSVLRDPERKTRWTVMPDKVVFNPLEPEEERNQADTINLFNGLLMEPLEEIGIADVLPMLELAEHLTSRASEDPAECKSVKRWLLDWIALPLRKPGTKLRSAVVMHGDEGAGKNFFFETLLECYGEYGKAVGQDELEDKFNDWRSRTLFVLADEASSRQELVHNKNRLKALITSPTVQINPKNLPRREEANHMNIAFLSNEITPLALDNTDRRYLVIFTPPAREPEFYQRLSAWRKDGGARKWLTWLLTRRSLDLFDPYAPPPVTSAKRDLIDLNRKTPERFWVEWSAGELDLPYRSCSVDQAYRAYTKYAQRSGDRYPLMKPVFSRMVVRIAESLKRPAKVKTMRVRDEADEDRSTRMLLVTEPAILNGVTESEWASSTVAAFERDLRRYLHVSHSLDLGNDGGEPS